MRLVLRLMNSGRSDDYVIVLGVHGFPPVPSGSSGVGVAGARSNSMACKERAVIDFLLDELRHHRSDPSNHGRPLIVGLQGPQGSGRSKRVLIKANRTHVRVSRLTLPIANRPCALLCSPWMVRT